MNKLKQLQIKGHGANRKLNIKLSKHVTCITGRSYIGKSWSLRALKWVCRNKPAGTSFINWDSKVAKVRLSVNKDKITRIRSKSKNLYKLDGRKHPYVGFGNKVPEKISEILNLDDINFQTQHATPFWFSETAGEVSKQLNSIVNLELIDSTLANIASKLKTTTAEISVTENDLEEALEKKQQLRYIDKLNERLKSLEKLQKQYRKYSARQCLLDEKIKLVSNYTSQWKNTANRGQRLRKLIVLTENCEKYTEPYEKLNFLMETIKNKKEELCQSQKNLKLKKERFTKLASQKCPLCGK